MMEELALPVNQSCTKGAGGARWDRALNPASNRRRAIKQLQRPPRRPAGALADSATRAADRAKLDGIDE